MKWALLFLLLSGDSDPQRPEIIKTFVNGPQCIKERDAKREHYLELKKRGPVPNIFLDCVPYTGPWKKEVKM